MYAVMPPSMRPSVRGDGVVPVVMWSVVCSVSGVVVSLVSSCVR